MSKLKYFGLILLTTLFMGVAFPVGKMGLSYAPPFLLMGIRYVLSGGLLAVIVGWKSRPSGRKQWLQVAVIGLFQSAAVMGCVYYSMRWITSGESAIITFLSPLLVIVLGTLLKKEKYHGRQWLGVVLGFIGVVITFGLHLSVNIGTFIGLVGAICFASATMLIKRWGTAFDMTVLAAYQMLSGGIALLVLSAITEHPHFTVSAPSVAIVFCLVLFCSILQFSIWFYLLNNGETVKTSTFLFLAPLFGVVSSWLLLGEQVQWYVVVGGAFICLGIFLVNWEGSYGPSKRSTKEPSVHVV